MMSFDDAPMIDFLMLFFRFLDADFRIAITPLLDAGFRRCRADGASRGFRWIFFISMFRCRRLRRRYAEIFLRCFQITRRRRCADVIISCFFDSKHFLHFDAGLISLLSISPEISSPYS